MDYIDLLQSFGISDKEAKVLYFCMQVEGVSASDLAKKTSIERTNVYKILEKLISRGFVTTYKMDNVNRYRSLEPKDLLDLLRTNFEKFEQNLNLFEKLYSNKMDSPKVELFTGRVAIRNVIYFFVNKNLPYSAFGGVEEAYRQNYFENISSGLLAQKRKISGRVILSPKEKTVILPNEEYRIAPTPLPKNVCTIMNKELVAIFNWGSYCNAIVITDKKIAQDYLTLFESLWIQAKKTSNKSLLSLTLKDSDIKSIKP